MTAIGYIRLSDEDQSNYSIDSQERQIKEYCNRNNLTLLKIYQDNGQSSYTFDRKAYNKLEKEIKQAQFLVVYHLDRFSRNMAEAMIKIKQYLEAGIRVRDITEPVDMDDYDPNTFLLRSMKFMVAESELHRIRQRTRQGIVQALMNGRHVNRASVGYINAKDSLGKAIINIDETKAPMIRIIFRECFHGTSIQEIRRRLKIEGYIIKGNSTVQRILENPIYAGLIKVPKTKYKSAHLVKGIHDPIISEFDFWRIQDLLKKRTITVRNSEEVPLRGVLHCGCGRRFTAGDSKGKTKYYWYYVCHSCSTNLSAIKLHDQFDKLLAGISIDNDNLAKIREGMFQKLKTHLATKDGQVNEIRGLLSAVEKKISNAERKYLSRPDMNEDTYNTLMAELRTEQSRLYGQLVTMESSEVEILFERINVFLESLGNVKEWFDKQSLEKKHQFITMVFDGSLSYENGTYRTQKLHHLFAHNELKLKEKGLLEIVAPVINLENTPRSSGIGSPVELPGEFLDEMNRLFAVFVA